MSQCYHCKKEVAARSKKCPHCGGDYPLGRKIWTFPPVIIIFLACCGICFGYLRLMTGLAIWLSAVLAIPIVVAFFLGMMKIASWSDCRDEHR